MQRLLDMSWDGLNPDLHPFDRDRARETVGRLRPAADVPAPPDTRPGHTWVSEAVAPWYRAMDEALTEEYGPWAIGWHWIRLSGGPVSVWGTPAESITTPDETLDRVASALVEWRGFLETLAEIFDGFSVHGGRPGDDGPWLTTRSGRGSGYAGPCRGRSWVLRRPRWPGDGTARSTTSGPSSRPGPARVPPGSSQPCTGSGRTPRPGAKAPCPRRPAGRTTRTPRWNSSGSCTS